MIDKEMNMTTFDFGFGPVWAHQHPYGGGWVADTAKVAATAYVGLNARVFGKARVTDYVWTFDYARVSNDAEEDMFIEMNGKRYKLVEVE